MNQVLALPPVARCVSKDTRNSQLGEGNTQFACINDDSKESVLSLVITRYAARQAQQAAQQVRNLGAMVNPQKKEFIKWLEPARHIEATDCSCCPNKGYPACPHENPGTGTHFCTRHPANRPLVNALNKIRADPYVDLSPQEIRAFYSWIPVGVRELTWESKESEISRHRAVSFAQELSYIETTIRREQRREHDNG
ncbi:hypothetical protein ACFL2P_01650 [Candidatus Moduliflexota bacterium]